MSSAPRNLKTRIQHKNDLEYYWLKATNFIPLKGELIIYDREVDTTGATLTTVIDGKTVTLLPEGRTTPYTYARVKIGDGVRTVGQLEFIDSGITYDIGNTTTAGITKLYSEPGDNTDGTMTQEAITEVVENLIGCGTSDPDSNTAGQFYFKYSAE